MKEMLGKVMNKREKKVAALLLSTFVFILLMPFLPQLQPVVKAESYTLSFDKTWADPANPNIRYWVGLGYYEIWRDSGGSWDHNLRPGDSGANIIGFDFDFNFPGYIIKNVESDEKFIVDDGRHQLMFDVSRGDTYSRYYDYLSTDYNKPDVRVTSGQNTSRVIGTMSVSNLKLETILGQYGEDRTMGGKYAPGVEGWRYYVPVIYKISIEPIVVTGTAHIKHYKTDGTSLSSIFPDREVPIISGQTYNFEHPTHSDYTYKGWKKSTTTAPSGGSPTSYPSDPFPLAPYDGSFSDYYVYFYYQDKQQAYVSLDVRPSDKTIKVGGKQEFVAYGISPGNSEQAIPDEEVTWTTSNSVASIDPLGWATGISIGTTTVKAVWNSLSDTASLTVEANTTPSITGDFDITPPSIKYRDPFSITPKNITTIGACIYTGQYFKLENSTGQSVTTTKITGQTTGITYTYSNYPYVMQVGTINVYMKVEGSCGDSGWIGPKPLVVEGPDDNSPPQFKVGWVEPSEPTVILTQAVVGEQLDLIYIDDPSIPTPVDPEGDPFTFQGFDMAGSTSSFIRSIPTNYPYNEYIDGWHSITLETEGTHRVTAKMCDSWGACSTKTATINVVPPNPVAVIEGPTEVVEGRPLPKPFTSDLSYSPMRRTIDHSRDEWTNKRTTYSTPGIEIIQLHVYDSAGLKSRTPASHTLTVKEDKPPVPVLEFATPAVRNTLVLFKNTSFSPDNDVIATNTVTMRYDSNNDGSFANETATSIMLNARREFTQTFDKVGKYQFTVFNQEDWGKTATTNFVIDVINEAPMATFELTSTMKEPFVPQSVPISSSTFMTSAWQSSNLGAASVPKRYFVNGNSLTSMAYSQETYRPMGISPNNVTIEYYMSDMLSPLIKDYGYDYDSSNSILKIYKGKTLVNQISGVNDVESIDPLHYRMVLRQYSGAYGERFRLYNISDIIKPNNPNPPIVNGQDYSAIYEGNYRYRPPEFSIQNYVLGRTQYYNQVDPDIHIPMKNQRPANGYQDEFAVVPFDQAGIYPGPTIQKVNQNLFRLFGYAGSDTQGNPFYRITPLDDPNCYGIAKYSATTGLPTGYCVNAREDVWISEDGNLAAGEEDRNLATFNANTGTTIAQQDWYYQNANLVGVVKDRVVVGMLTNQGVPPTYLRGFNANLSQVYSIALPSDVGVWANMAMSGDGFVVVASQDGKKLYIYDGYNGAYKGVINLSFNAYYLRFLDDGVLRAGDYLVKSSLFASREDPTNGQLLNSSLRLTHYEVSYTLNFRDMSSPARAGFAFRAQDYRNFYRVETNYGSTRLVKYVNGQQTILAERAYEMERDTDYSFRIKAIGSDITVYVNGAPIIQVQESTFSSGMFGPFAKSGYTSVRNVSYADWTPFFNSGGDVLTNVAVVGEPITYSMTVIDPENDPIAQPLNQWLYQQTSFKFLDAGDGKSGGSAYHNKTYTGTQPSLDKVGVYRVTLRVTDDPHPNYRYPSNIFNSYRKQSNPYSVDVIAHRRPFARFTVGINADRTIAWNYQDYDPDRWLSASNYSTEATGIDYRATRGILDRKFNYTTPSGATKDGQLLRPSESGKYTVRMASKDEYGAWSDWYEQTITIANPLPANEPPIAAMTYPSGTQAAPTMETSRRPTFRWTQTDSDPGTVFQRFQVQVTNENNTAFILDSGERAQSTTAASASWAPTTDLPTGQKLRVRVKVFDGVNWSAWSAQTWILINHAPTAVNTYPSGTQTAPTLVKTQRPAITWNQTDPDPGTLFEYFEAQVINEANTWTFAASGQYWQGTTATTGRWTVNADLPESQKLKVRVRVFDRIVWSAWSSYTWMMVDLNSPPAADFVWSPNPAWEGDTITLSNLSTDPDGDPLTYHWSIAGPAGYSTTAMTKDATIAGVDTSGRPGIWTVSLTVTDPSGESNSIAKTVMIGDLGITGQVLHTADWESYRQAWNSKHPAKQRPPSTFWAGEAFELRATLTDTASSTTKPQRVTAELAATGDTTALSSADHVYYTGQMLNTNFGKMLSDGAHTMHFTVTWNNGHVENCAAPFAILGGINDVIVTQLRN
jgi:hypothetical protein